MRYQVNDLHAQHGKLFRITVDDQNGNEIAEFVYAERHHELAMQQAREFCQARNREPAEV